VNFAGPTKYAHPVSKKFVELYAQFFLKIYRVPIGCFVIKSVSRKLGSNKLRNNYSKVDPSVKTAFAGI